jgi:serine/threonine-protein kinase
VTGPQLSIGATVGERHRLVREIATGAMGSVFEAESTDGARVAVKTLLSTRGKKDGPERRARFLREAALSATLLDPHIVPVLDHGVDAPTDTPYLVMPLLRGEDLARVIERVGAIDPNTCVAIFVQACRGLEVAHRAGVVHRDVKPSNLFLEADASGSVVVKVADFGLAKVFDDTVQSLTASGRFMGTPHYVSPEQATNAKRVDVRSDVWSLAMSLYHALAGVPPFANVKSFMQLVLELTGPNGVRPLQDVAPWIDPRIARVVHGALVADLDLRCPSIAELGLALEMAVGIDVARAHIAATEVRGVTAPERSAAELPSSWDELLRFG